MYGKAHRSEKDLAKVHLLGRFLQKFSFEILSSKICINSYKCKINLYKFVKIYLTFAPPTSVLQPREFSLTISGVCGLRQIEKQNKRQQRIIRGRLKGWSLNELSSN